MKINNRTDRKKLKHISTLYSVISVYSDFTDGENCDCSLAAYVTGCWAFALFYLIMKMVLFLSWSMYSRLIGFPFFCYKSKTKKRNKCRKYYICSHLLCSPYHCSLLLSFLSFPLLPLSAVVWLEKQSLFKQKVVGLSPHCISNLNVSLPTTLNI